MSTDLSSEGQHRIYRILCNLAGCDGHVDPSERRVLADTAREFGITPADAATLEAEGLASEGLVIGETEGERAELIRRMIDVAAADGRLDSAERKRLVRVAKEIGLGLTDRQAQLLPRLEGSS